VFDDSSLAAREKYYSLLEQTRTHNELYYVGAREKDLFQLYVNERLRDKKLAALVKNLLRPSYGGKRNYTLLYTLGGSMVSADDDMRPWALVEHSPESLSDDGDVTAKDAEEILTRSPRFTNVPSTRRERARVQSGRRPCASSRRIWKGPSTASSRTSSSRTSFGSSTTSSPSSKARSSSGPRSSRSDTSKGSVAACPELASPTRGSRTKHMRDGSATPIAVNIC
jgi:hypothetical protein